MKNPLVKKPETNSQNSTNSQEKYPENLEEQRDYYLKLYQKWANWQKESPEKLPEGFQRAEFLVQKGAVDMIVDRRKMREELAHVLALLQNQAADVLA